MSERKIYTVQICTGTLCHLMGGAELPDLADYLSNSLKTKIIIKGMVCANYCKNAGMKPPFVMINEELIQEASIEKIILFLQNCERNDTNK